MRTAPGDLLIHQGAISMSLILPAPITAYFAADKDDSDTVARCFTENAVVTDEGHTYRGIAAIKQWKAAASKKYTYASEPFASLDEDGKTIVTSRLTGNFPGSPVNLRYVFGLEGDSIASLVIKP
jgi:hypothetical protein